MIHPFPRFAVVDFAPEHALSAARLHVAGQPGTFLTSLGIDVLTIIYRALPATAAGFGVVAMDDTCRVLGFASATTSTGSLFVNVALQHSGDLFRSLVAAAIRNPALLGRIAATAAYPLQVAQSEDVRSAELLSIMVAPEARGMGIGGVLLGALVALSQVRNVRLLDVTVDAANAGARRFYAAHGFVQQQEFTLYGRPMCQYIGAIPNAPRPTMGASQESHQSTNAPTANPPTYRRTDLLATDTLTTDTLTTDTLTTDTLTTDTLKAPPAA